jgi:hypothetical protein
MLTTYSTEEATTLCDRYSTYYRLSSALSAPMLHTVQVLSVTLIKSCREHSALCIEHIVNANSACGTSHMLLDTYVQLPCPTAVYIHIYIYIYTGGHSHAV